MYSVKLILNALKMKYIPGVKFPILRVLFIFEAIDFRNSGDWPNTFIVYFP